ncbi:helix-turn-helix domain-containing protein [Paenibacillus nuruki]|uniref:helix-turn-helix domain-containing protein n=1 Tax=Paenibacillus nuruki TaxID=1886670 RepID=UPI00352E7DF8
MSYIEYVFAYSFSKVLYILERRGSCITRRKLTPFGLKVRKRLLDLGISQIQLAEQIGTSKSYLNHVLYGERSGKKYKCKIIDHLKMEDESIDVI